MPEYETKELKKLQATLCCGLKKKFEQQQQETGFLDAQLVRFIIGEYYSKIKTDYNK